MKFSVSSSDLLKQLQIAGGAIASNPVLPILEDFLFVIKNNQLTISATDLETSIVTRIDVTSDGDGTVAVPAKILLDTLKELPMQPITFLVNDENYGIEIKLEITKNPDEEVKFLTGKDKFASLARKNPNMHTLKTLFNLDIEY